MFSLDMMELGVTYWRRTNQPNQWFLKDDIAKRNTNIQEEGQPSERMVSDG